MKGPGGLSVDLLNYIQTEQYTWIGPSWMAFQEAGSHFFLSEAILF